MTGSPLERIGKILLQLSEHGQPKPERGGSQDECWPEVGSGEFTVEEQAAPTVDERGHRVESQNRHEARWNALERIDNGRHVEHQEQDNIQHRPQVSEEDIHRREQGAQSYQQDELQGQQQRYSDYPGKLRVDARDQAEHGEYR